MTIIRNSLNIVKSAVFLCVRLERVGISSDFFDDSYAALGFLRLLRFL